MLEAGSMCVSILINLIGFLASNSIAVQRTDLTHLVVSDIAGESDFLIKFVTC